MADYNSDIDDKAVDEALADFEAKRMPASHPTSQHVMSNDPVPEPGNSAKQPKRAIASPSLDEPPKKRNKVQPNFPTFDANRKLLALNDLGLEKIAERRTYNQKYHGELTENSILGTKLMTDINAMVFCIGVHRPLEGQKVRGSKGDSTCPVGYSSSLHPGSRFNKSGVWNVPARWSSQPAVNYVDKEEANAVDAVALKAVVETLDTIFDMMSKKEGQFINTFVIIVPNICVVQFFTTTCMKIEANEQKGVVDTVLKDPGHMVLCRKMLFGLETLEQNNRKVLFKPSGEDKMDELASQLASEALAV